MILKVPEHLQQELRQIKSKINMESRSNCTDESWAAKNPQECYGTSSFARFSYFCVYVGAWTIVLPERSAIRGRLARASLMASALSLSFFPRLPSSRLPHGLGFGSPPSLSFFPRLPGSSLPHGVGVGSPPSLSLSWLTRKAWRTVPLCKHAIDPTWPWRWGLPYLTNRPYVNMVTSHPSNTHTRQKFCSIDI